MSDGKDRLISFIRDGLTGLLNPQKGISSTTTVGKTLVNETIEGVKLIPKLIVPTIKMIGTIARIITNK